MLAMDEEPIALAKADASWSWVMPLPPLFCLEALDTEPASWEVAGLKEVSCCEDNKGVWSDCCC